MSTIHVASPSGVQSQHEEEQLRRMWEMGLLQEGTQYWREGMPEWRPISDLFRGGVVAGSPVPPPMHGATYSYSKNPQSLTSFLVLMLWISLAMHVVSMLGDFSQMSLLSGSFSMDEAEANDARQRMIGLACLGVFIVTGVAFLKWIHRANLNCRGFGAKDMQFTPGWSIGYYFIPFLNLVRPYQAMKEIWQVSHNPRDWKSQSGSALLGWWWALWLSSGFIGQGSFRLSLHADTLEDLQTATGASILSSIIDIIVCLVAVTLVKTISNKQNSLVTKG